MTMPHRIIVSDDVYEYLKGMIDDEHIQNGDMSEERNAREETIAHRPTFSEVVQHLIDDREGAA
jgi:predicted CopG family antitoxin